MNPAFSVVVFTVLAGAAQGLVVAIAIAALARSADADFASRALWLATAMLVAALAASFAHLGRPERAWRAAAMWRTSWLSREVIVLPAFAALVAAWAWLVAHGGADGFIAGTVLPAAAIVLALGLWWCTAMIYACLRFIEEWAHRPLTIATFTLTGLASGGMLAAALAATARETQLAASIAPAAIMLTLAAGALRGVALGRNARLRHRSTAQSATGIRAERLAQQSMGMSAGSFNTREFFHGRRAATLAGVRWALFAFGYVLPAAAALAAISGAAGIICWWLAVASQAIGLLADRWYFFAEAKHPQNLYYQVVS